MLTYKTETEQPRLVIQLDSSPSSPREDSNIGYFIIQSNKYNSPDTHNELQQVIRDTAQYATSSEDHMKRIVEDFSEKILFIDAVAIYEHSGLSYSLGYKSGWDWSNNGFYIVTEKSIQEIGIEYDVDKVKQIIEGELETYTKYANGEIYGYTLYDEDGEEIDSCWGFYDVEHIREYLPAEFEDEDLDEYIKY